MESCAAFVPARRRRELGSESAAVGSACVCWGEWEGCSWEAVTEGAFVRAEAGGAGAALPQSTL